MLWILVYYLSDLINIWPISSPPPQFNRYFLWSNCICEREIIFFQFQSPHQINSFLESVRNRITPNFFHFIKPNLQPQFPLSGMRPSFSERGNEVWASSVRFHLDLESVLVWSLETWLHRGQSAFGAIGKYFDLAERGPGGVRERAIVTQSYRYRGSLVEFMVKTISASHQLRAAAFRTADNGW